MSQYSGSASKAAADLATQLEKMNLDVQKRTTMAMGPGGGPGNAGGEEWTVEKLECPVCLDICCPPSYTCANRHLVCGNCQAKGIISCPICRNEKLIEFKQLEDLVRKLRFKCSNYGEGCALMVSTYEARNHEDVCQFRPIHCQAQGCELKVPFCLGLKQHLLEDHRKEVGHNMQKTVDMILPAPGADFKLPVQFILLGNSAIAVHFEIKDKEVRAWAIYPGYKKTTDHILNLTFSSMRKIPGEVKARESCLNWNGPVLGDTVTPGITGLEFKINVDTLRGYAENNKLTFVAGITVSPKPALSETGAVSSSAWIPKCAHYKRSCSLVCPRCSGIFGCRVCHDDAKDDHKLDRHSVKFVLCHICGTQQPADKHCGSCGVEFGKYFCRICHFYENGKDPRLFFHCGKCGICRVKPDLMTDFTHCDSCGICVSSTTISSHPCRRNAAKQNCGVCREDLHSSREAIVSNPCGHYFHKSCQNRLNGPCPSCIPAFAK